MSKVRVTGLHENRLELRQLGDRAVNGATRQMRRAADNIVKTAKDYVPEDSQALKNSIRVESDRAGINGRLQIDVVVGGQTVDRDNGEVFVADVNLDQYAMIIHENYEAYKPGPRTLAKMAGPNGDKVGSHFLSRAAEEEEKKLQQQMFDLMSTLDREENDY